MKKLSQDEQDIFFAVIRAAVWEHEVKCPIPESTDWEALIEAFNEHSILGTVASTLIKLSAEVKELAPYMGTVVFPFVANLTRTHNKLDQAIVEVFDRLESQGCHPVLLKGQGLSALYPKTCVRSCGDIDLYVRESEYEKACYTINDMLGIDNAAVDIYKDPKHYHAEKGSIIYEVHRLLIGNKKYVGHTDAINVLAQESLSAELPTITVLGKGIPVPSGDFNDWYIFYHLYTHFMKGVGIRQFIDWMMVLKSNNHRDSVLLQKDIAIIGLCKEWNNLGYILTHYLDLPTDDFPLYDQGQHFFPKKSVDRIIYGGDFGKNHAKDLHFRNREQGLCRDIRAFLYHTSHLYEVARTYSLSYAFFQYKKSIKKGLVRYLRKIL